MNDLIGYPFFDLDNLKSCFLKDKLSIGSKFERIIVIGVGGSSQGSKAINGFLNEDRVVYFDHLNHNLISKTLEKDLDRTGFIFISKSGTTSETLTIFDYLIGQLESKIDYLFSVRRIRNYFLIASNCSIETNFSSSSALIS